ncbi:hypothetical protein P3L51_03465 [Streptomyces sp. PSRA5]|uniref:hypothetical protein n=1 Tax=Streptomyces panacea TaxID=3035064 RepID=UPI00339C1A8A
MGISRLSEGLRGDAAFHFGNRRTAVAVVVLVQAALPTWLNATESAVLTDGHHRLPPVWHHSGPAMALLNLLAGLGLAWLLRLRVRRDATDRRTEHRVVEG